MGSLALASQGKEKQLQVGPAGGTQECLIWCHSPPQYRRAETYKSHFKTHLYPLWKRTKNRGVNSFRQSTLSPQSRNKLAKEGGMRASLGGMKEGVRGWCTGKTQRDRVEKEVEGGIGMGNTCKSMADSCQCMAKTTTIL